ncbi:ATPase [Sphingomonas sp.]|uniref:F0F1 ATP synthase subunit B family protein n=1 Tax=Sphingomonas sp. TaxID=28214 RepID=UPI001B299F71|nr:ATPase [Sphingomonas sp.]MBO9715205.1 ATPase [Sphingomonas sp.]
MPQLSQIGEIYASQLFWLAIVFALIYFGIGKAMVPRIERTIENRATVIQEDLAAAEATSDAAHKVQATYEAGLNSARAEALRLTGEAKAAASAAAEAKVKAAAAADEARVAQAAADLQARTGKALAEVEGAAVDAAEAIVAKLSGVTVDRADVAQRVKAVLANG